ncbi:MAG TPA: hypothetical protein VFE62_23345, partial [Gemmataceae bacterium]|nr:hypothetical protein [Gemmataceae bacterium]
EQLGAGRVGFYRQPVNVGSTKNFNTCLQRSTGHLVHILHSDDWVLPGFYDRVELSVRRHPQVALFATRSFVVDEAGDLNALSPRVASLEVPSKDVSGFLYSNQLFTPSVVVRRTFYESAGGFLEQLRHTADWEMWVRALSTGGGCVINQPLACYRHFAANESNRYARTAENVRDFLRLRDVFAGRFPEFSVATFNQMAMGVAAAQAQNFRRLQDIEAAVSNESVCRDLRNEL